MVNNLALIETILRDRQAVFAEIRRGANLQNNRRGASANVNARPACCLLILPGPATFPAAVAACQRRQSRAGARVSARGCASRRCAHRGLRLSARHP